MWNVKQLVILMMINVFDVVILVNMILYAPGYNSIADLNSDGSIDILDVVQLVNIILNN